MICLLLFTTCQLTRQHLHLLNRSACDTVHETIKTTLKQHNKSKYYSLVCIDYKYFTSIYAFGDDCSPDFVIYDFRSLNHTSVVCLRHHCTAAVSVTADRCSFLRLVFTFSGSVRVQHVLQYVFAFTGGQIVEEVQWCHLNEPKTTKKR